MDSEVRDLERRATHDPAAASKLLRMRRRLGQKVGLNVSGFVQKGFVLTRLPSWVIREFTRKPAYVLDRPSSLADLPMFVDFVWPWIRQEREARFSASRLHALNQVDRLKLERVGR